MEDHRGKTAYAIDLSGMVHIQSIGAIPDGFTFNVPPKPKNGHVIRWGNDDWECVEDHRGKTGYVNGEQTTITELGPLPDGWDTNPPPEPDPDPVEVRRTEIISALNKIDRDAIRPLRAIAAGHGTDEDTEKLQQLDARAEELRAELAALPKQG
jgi:hypothetical protein